LSLSLVAGFSSEALAQRGRPGGAPAMAAPHIAAPAPHMAAPAAPHFAAPAAPHFAAPAAHFAAPAPHMAAPRMTAAPHFAAPHMAPHFAAPARSFAAHSAPHFATHAAPHIASHGMPHANFARIEHGHGMPHGGPIASQALRHNGEAARHAALPSSQISRPSLANGKSGPGNRAERQPLGAPGQTVGSTTHQPTGRPETAVNRAATTQTATARPRTLPILQNSAFANQRMATTSRMAPSQQTFRGQFAQAGWSRDWRHHHHDHFGIVLGFVGPVFWPYAYDDFVDYTFAPYAYDTFWPYAFDDVYAGIYGGYAPEYYGPEDAYAYAGSVASQRSYARTAAVNGTSGPGATGGSDRICSSEAAGVTDFSIQKIAQQVNPDQQQQALLDDLKAASIEAVKILQAACPTELPSTPTGRLAAMRARVDAMLKAVQMVRPPLEKFYASLNDEQRERFNALDQSQQTASAQPAELDRLCKRHEASSHALPIDRIERTLHLNADQDAALKELDETTAKAAEQMQTSCQPAQTLTPTGRLAAMETRLTAMSQALQTTEAALNKFYGALTDEQKAQFNRMSIRAA
jgi:hypothetical protein